MTSLWFCLIVKFIYLSKITFLMKRFLNFNLVSSLQLTTYWEKTFKLDLFRPQIGVVNVTDVSKA